ATAQSAQSFGRGQIWCGIFRGGEALSQWATLALAPSGLKNFGKWIKSPFWYEISEKTLPDSVYRVVQYLPPGRVKGEIIVDIVGWKDTIFDLHGNWLATLIKGPTPGGLFGLYGFGTFGLGSLADLGDCGCK